MTAFVIGTLVSIALTVRPSGILETFSEIGKTLSILRMIALAALAASTSAQAQTAEPERQTLFQEVDGAYMMNVGLVGGQECQIAQFTGPNINMLLVGQGPAGAQVIVFTPITPVAPSGRQDIRLDMSNGSASFDMTLDMTVARHPNEADHWVLKSNISGDEATALLSSSQVTATSSDGIRLTTLAAPSALRASARRAFDACKSRL